MRSAAEILRDDGILRAVDHADAVHEKWSDKALAMLIEYIDLIGGTGSQFTSEMARFYAEEQGLPKPPDKRAWGAVMLGAARTKKCKKIGWTTASDPKVHCNPVSLWEAI
jgi:hypothetical protein